MKSELLYELLHEHPLPSDNRFIRDLLVERVSGWGYKESSHFMRNIGRGQSLAIIDRHIITCMLTRGLIPADDIGSEGKIFSLNSARYHRYEDIICEYADRLGIPHAHLDQMWWASQSGTFFK